MRFFLKNIPVKKGKGFLLLFPVVAGLLILAILWSGAAIRLAAQDKTYDDIQAIPHHSVGLVLGCSQYFTEKVPNPFYQNRINAAIALFEAGKVDYLLVSGNGDAKGGNEPRAMRASLLYAGIPNDRITLDEAGFRTLDSIVRAKEIFAQSEITVISQKFHNQRAIFLAKHAGVEAIGFNAAEVDPLSNLRTQCREQLARVKAVLDVFVFGIPSLNLNASAPVNDNHFHIP